jgi:hypothetical protein
MAATPSNQMKVPVQHDSGPVGSYVEPEGAGWLFFAGTVLGVAGVMRILDGIWAFRYEGSLPDNLQDGVLGDDLTAYAWTWTIIGVVLLVASVMVLSRSQFARWVGLFAAAVGCVTAVVWMPYYPVWSFTYIALCMLVIYALATYGGRQTTGAR